MGDEQKHGIEQWVSVAIQGQKQIVFAEGGQSNAPQHPKQLRTHKKNRAATKDALKRMQRGVGFEMKKCKIMRLQQGLRMGMCEVFAKSARKALLCNTPPTPTP